MSHKPNKFFATYVEDKSIRASKKEMATLRQVLSKIMATLESTDMLDKEVLMAID